MLPHFHASAHLAYAKFAHLYPPDMTIEQVLILAMETSGGLTRGRGMTESVIGVLGVGQVRLQ